MDATITLTSACEVNGSTGTTNVDFGTLDFGTHTTLFTNSQAQVDGTGGAVAIRCTPGSDATFTVVSGLNDAAAPQAGRAMANGSLYVPYDLYSDAGFQNVLSNGSTLPVTADGTTQVLSIYGRAVGVTGLAAGTYSDTISVTLAF